MIGNPQRSHPASSNLLIADDVIKVISATLIACMAIVGCGSTSTAHAPRVRLVKSNSTVAARPRTFATSDVRTVGGGRLPGGRFSLFGERGEYDGERYFKLGVRLEEAGPHGPISAGGGAVSMRPGGYGALSIEVERGCVGGFEYGLVYGLLRDSSDSVSAERNARSLRLKKRAIPASLGEGTLVYSLLPPGPVSIVTRTTSGRIVDEEHFSGRRVAPCHRL
jgi:hypothetical protein